MKLYNGVNVSSHFYRNDVYNFNLSGTDEPIIKLGVSQKSVILYLIFILYYAVTRVYLFHFHPYRYALKYLKIYIVYFFLIYWRNTG